MAHPYFEHRRSRAARIEARCRAAFAEMAGAFGGAAFTGERVVDIGCSTGEFLIAARQLFGIEPLGLDVSPAAVARARQHGIDAEVATVETAPVRFTSLAAATAIDVIEHVMEPVTFLRQIAARLRPGGMLYLETPNPHATVYRLGAWLSRLMAGRPEPVFERLFPPEHQYYFPPQALRLAAEHAGFEVTHVFTRPIPWEDAALSLPINTVMAIAQRADLLTGNATLLCMTARKAAPPLDAGA